MRTTVKVSLNVELAISPQGFCPSYEGSRHRFSLVSTEKKRKTHQESGGRHYNGAASFFSKISVILNGEGRGVQSRAAHWLGKCYLFIQYNNAARANSKS